MASIDFDLYCAKAEGCRVLDGITNVTFETGFIEVLRKMQYHYKFFLYSFILFAIESEMNNIL